MSTAIPAHAPNATTAAILRDRLLVTTALAPLVLAVLPALLPGPALAACTVTGTGTIGALNSGDVATCTGVGNTDHINATGSSNVTVDVGDGTTTSLTPGAGIPAIVFDGTTSSNITVNNQATASTSTGAVLLSNGSNNNNVTIAAGGIAEATSIAEAAIVIDNSNGNLVGIRGTAVGTGGNTHGLRISGTSTGNVVTVYQGGLIDGGHTAVQILAGGNTFINAGTILGGFFLAIQGSSGIDTIVNSGTITTGGSGAVDLFGGDDVFVLAPGSSITGTVRGGTGIDTLGFGGDGSATFDLGTLGASLQYDEFEQLTKTGSSVWTLTGTTSFNGATTVDAGGLIVNGTLPSVVTVNGGYLGGTGTVGGLVVNNGGTVAPGNSIGTLNVNGNVAFNAGSTFQVEINAAGQSDKIAATGTATLNGGTVKIVPLGSGFIANTQYTILTATGGVSGTFATLASSGAPLVTGQLSYDVNNVYFILQQIGGFGTVSGLTPNQASVAGALDQAQLGGASGPLTTAINTLAALNTSGIKAGLDDLAGQIHADGRRFVADQADMFQSFMWNAGTQSRGETLRVSATAYAPEPADPIGKALAGRRTAPARSVWFGGYGNWDKVAASDIAFGTNTAIAGAALGADLWHMPGFTAGLAVGASTGQLRMAGRADRIDANAGHAGFYARGESGGFNLASAISYSFAALESSRTIAFLGETATASSRANTFAASLGIARPFATGWGFTVEPFAKADWYSTRQGSLSETGAPGVNQLVRAGSFDVAYGTAGLRTNHRMMVPSGQTAQFGATLAVRHEFTGSAASTTVALEGAPGIPFAITGVERARTVALTGAEMRWDFTTATSFKASYEGAFAPGYDRHTLRGLVRSEF
ncbi:autotransporter outer membrane beta-barrel domain-containing protein [Bradyrhizobium cajani]|uniref:Autotransporter domain-containing protein n=1 Tax=Bradyrhizobium cajani TaxID=1928661 RepID=A0A844T892_9BRAD|nr:autotransporter outer membrane beta-barrel domain-containing protein [Bradyrhizobium cajani]MCP3371683.1 autotransporter domain-containing protein [Bradyrhizobium cajani]MVT72649.1 autotransporter domain-containing protein [Bradyrhizobium cajani]